MTSNDISLAVLLGALTAAYVSVRGVRIAPARISSFELQRRVKQGDESARAQDERMALLPWLVTFRRLVEVSLSVLMTIVIAGLLGLWLGIVAAVLLFILCDMFLRYAAFRHALQKKYEEYEPRLLQLVQKWEWLRFFGHSEMAVKDITIDSKPELINLIDRSRGVLTEDERRRLASAISFNSVVVQDIMTPRSMVDSIDQAESIGPLVLDQLHKTGHSRFPVTDGDIDHVVGMLYLHDLITLRSQHETAKEAMQQKVFYIRQDYTLERALRAFLRTHHHLFIVVNEFRETVGLLSLEDVIESLLGYQVIDEFDEYHDLRKVAASYPRSNNEPKGKTNI